VHGAIEKLAPRDMEPLSIVPKNSHYARSPA